MKKRLFSILLALCMVLCLVPTTAFAESETEEPPVCSCETACTTDNMNKECPVCGAENAIPQNCGQYIPVEDRTGENGSTERADDPNGPIELSAADQVQAMIDGLPNAEEITEDNAEEVKAQLDAIDEAKEKLSDEETDELDMTRYAEAAAALGALAAPMLLANDSPDEQFSLTPGGRYYFDLSAMGIPGTVNGGLPDTTLHYVPFTYAGTVDAYKLTSAMATTEEHAEQNKYDHSLFIADYNVTFNVDWNQLNEKQMIFGTPYTSYGVNYTMRAPSAGSQSNNNNGKDDSSTRGIPKSNEWDAILDKANQDWKDNTSGYIKNWSRKYSFGQDNHADASIRAVRGFDSARYWRSYYASYSFLFVGFRPVLEVLNPDTLGSDGLKAVTLDLNGGTLGGSSDAIQIIVKNGSAFTAPASDGMTRPAGDTGSYFMWLGSDGKLYAPGASVPADVTKLTAQFALSEQFSLTPGGRYYFDLSAMNIPGTVNGGLPDTTLHYVPFTYAGTIEAYKLMSATATTEDYARKNKYAHSLFVADYAVTHTISWGGLNDEGLIFGKNYASGGVDYTLRAPSVGSNATGLGDSDPGEPQSNEWDTMLNKDSGYIQNWNKMYLWGQDVSSDGASLRAVRGYHSARFWGYFSSSGQNVSLGFRPVLEVLNPDTLGSDGLKAVTLDLNGGTLGGSSDAIQIIVKNGSAFTAPASDGMTRPAGDTGSYFMWLDGNGNSYEPGGSVPADVTELTVQWTAPTYAVTLNTNGGTINNGNVTEYTYGVGATLPTDVTRTGYTFKGWYYNENLTGSPVTAIGDTETGNKEYWAKWEINQYTVTVKPENGEADITITQDYGTPITAPTLTREGYQFNGWDKAFPTTMPAENLTITALWRDIAVPTGEIKIAENDWKSFLNTITFGLFFKDTQTVTVTATDNSGETVTIEYLLSEKALAESELAGMTFTAYSAPFSINPDNEYVIYAKLTDTSGNVAYINTNGIVLDGTSPVITGIEAGKTYCAAQTITVDEKYIGTVKVNGTEVILDENGQFILSPASGEQTIVVTDKAGNETRVIVTVNDGHTYEWQSENGQYWQKCKFCNHETAKKDIPTINISGADKVCRTQDYKFSFTLPEGATDAAYGYEFIGLGDGPLTPTVENGLYSGIIKASTYPAEENSFKLIVSAKTADGFDFSAEKTVTIQNEHTGGTATCIEQATCEICGEKYGDLKPHSYSPDWSTDETNHWHECTECRAKTDEVEHTDGNKDHKCDVCEKILSECTDTNKDHKCDLCGKTLSEHSGGKATCKDKAKCEFCGESYGELNVNNHSDLKHFPAVAATKTAEGNIEYWYCSGCKKYYKDATATQEIKQADTVTAKLPGGTVKPGADKSPQTGDNSNLLLWIALLFISGGAVTATTVYGRKKKRSVK
ncbi:MAG: InlB B-repeat-containing protein [Coprococcus sp.]